MTIEALPTYLNFPEATSNLAGPTSYRAWDGTPMGQGADCAPLTEESQLSAWTAGDVGAVYLGAVVGAAAGAAYPHRLRQPTRLRGAGVGAAVGAALTWLIESIR